MSPVKRMRSVRFAAVAMAAGVVAGLVIPAQAGPVQCDVDKFAANIKQAVHGKCVGYSVAIFKNGKLAKRFAGGLVRTGKDAPARSMSVNDQLELGSVSKTVNAIVMLKALEEKGISINTSIHQYLPSNWTVHKTLRDGKVTFRKLLSHTSGLKQFDRFDESKYGPGNYNDHVKEAVKLGVVQSQAAKYNNNNYELIRVLLAYVVNAKTAKLYEDPAKVKAQEVYFSSLLAAYAKTRVFYPSGIGPKPKLYDPTPADKAVRYYHFPSPGVAGVPGNDRRRYPGRGGWKMTAAEIAAIYHAWDAGKLLSAKMTADMKAYKMGIFYGDIAQGRYYMHNGKSHATNRSGKAQAMALPGNIQVALLLNSHDNTFGNKTTLLTKAFDDACKSADLQVTRFTAKGSPYYRDGKLVIPVRVVVINRGTATAKGKFAVGVRRLSTFRWTTLVDSIGPGKVRILSGKVMLPDPRKRLDGRTIKLTAFADAPIAAGDTSMPKWGRVKESNEANNLKSLSMKIAIPKRVGGKTTRPKRIGKAKVKTPVKRRPLRIRRRP